MEHLGLDVSYSRVPQSVRLRPSLDEAHVVFAKLAAAVHPRGSNVDVGHSPLTMESPKGSRLGPNTHLACFDTLYYTTSSSETFEWRFAWSPAWRFVGRHVRYNQNLVGLGEGYARRAMKVEDNAQELPKFIAVHMRRGDFNNTCTIPGHCITSVEPFVKAVESIQQRLRDEKNITVSRVLAASDETSAEFWEEISSLGWHYVDHETEGTIEKYGEWYPPLVDGIVQSLASGFVGTEDSTFSLVSGRRVEDWNDGVYTMVVGS